MQISLYSQRILLVKDTQIYCLILLMRKSEILCMIFLLIWPDHSLLVLRLLMIIMICLMILQKNKQMRVQILHHTLSGLIG